MPGTPLVVLGRFPAAPMHLVRSAPARAILRYGTDATRTLRQTLVRADKQDLARCFGLYLHLKANPLATSREVYNLFCKTAAGGR